MRFRHRHTLCALLCTLRLPEVLSYAPVTDDALLRIPQPIPSDFDIYTGTLLAPILIPRVPGSSGSATALTHFVEFFHSLPSEWTMSLQNSTSATPLPGNKVFPFTNLIASRAPPWSKPGSVGYLTLVAHYDSKISPEGFIGATDSAAPCAMILHAVRAIDEALTKKWSAVQIEGVDDLDDHYHGIQVLLLDGEEAFVSWTESDSVYGARSLAEEWDTDYYPAMSTYKTKLESIELFILLDLLGAEAPSIPSYFKTTHWAYQNMAKLEKRLRDLNQFRSPKAATWLTDGDRDAHDATAKFQSYWMQDDHIPFMARGVEVLHLIPMRFPSVWHKIEDDGEHLDIPTVEDWAMLTAAFAAEWLELDGFFDGPARPVGRSTPEKRHQDAVVSKTEL